MPNDGPSIGPDERVMIKFAAPQPGAEGEELPFRLAIVGDFTGREDQTPIAERKVYDINKSNFNDVMAAMNISVSFSVPDKKSKREGAEIPIELKIDNLNAFHPDNIVQQVPEIRKMVEVRQKVIELRKIIAQNDKMRKLIDQYMPQLAESESAKTENE